MKRLITEPLLHFFLLGVAIFAAYGLVAGRSGDEPGRILITRGQTEHLATGFARTWQRPPTAEELAGLVRDRVREEVYCREAMALGLDKDDPVIRRRLRQKMEFVSDDIAVQAQPTDAQLNAYLREHPDAFRVEQKFTFRQLYLNPERRGTNLESDAAELVRRLNLPGGGENDSLGLGDSFLLEHEFESVPAGEVARQFGEEFATKLRTLVPGQWQGPVESGYGAHLVRVSERTEGRQPELGEVRNAVAREWANARRLEANEKFYQGLLHRYVVTIERPRAMALGDLAKTR